MRGKHPNDWVLESWKNALRWFVREAWRQGGKAAMKDAESPPPIETFTNEWEYRLVSQLRKDNRMLRTEQTYRDWLRRYLAWLGGGDPRGEKPVDGCPLF